MRKPNGFNKLWKEAKYFEIGNEKFYFKYLSDDGQTAITVDGVPSWESGSAFWVLRDGVWDSSFAFGLWLYAIHIDWDAMTFDVARVEVLDGTDFESVIKPQSFNRYNAKDIDSFVKWVHWLLRKYSKI